MKRLAIITESGEVVSVHDDDGKPLDLDAYDLTKPLARAAILAAIDDELDGIAALEFEKGRRR